LGFDLARARTLLTSLALSLACAAGCGGTSRHPPPSGTGGEPSSSGGGPFSEAAHSPLPQLKYQGGLLLAAPEIVTVTFAGDANADALEAFDDDIVASAWWKTVTSGFCDGGGTCVGTGSSGGHVRLTTPPATSYTDATAGGPSTLQLFLSDQIGAGLLPPTGTNTLYVIYFPGSTGITLSEGGAQTATSCREFNGYHNAILAQGAPGIPYVVVPECAPEQGSNLDALQALTFAASHEILEGATDPFQTTLTPGQQTPTLGYYLDLNDNTVLGWDLLAGGEAGDLCVDVTGLHQDEATADGYTVQRIWSNANAAKGIDPCSPTPAGDIYFNVAPEGSSSFIVLDVGGTATFEVDGFSTEAIPAWTLEGVDWITSQGKLKSPLLSFSFNGEAMATIGNGSKVQVTVTLDADPGQYGGAEGLLLSVAGPVTAPTAAHVWPILVVTPAETRGGT
jgi:hypothetical protein